MANKLLFIFTNYQPKKTSFFEQHSNNCINTFAIMTSAQLTIEYITYCINIYVGYFILITGVFGNIVNLLIFTQLTLFRRNQAAFYLTVAGIADCWQLFFGAFTRAMATSSNYDPVQISIIWCKLRLYLIQFSSTSSAMIVCFTAFDQYLSTSHHTHIRQLSTYKLAQRLVSTLVLLAALYSTPTLVFQDIRRSSCVIYNSSYNYYFSFVHLCINIGLLPIVISTFFSLLSFRNVRRIVRRQIPVVRRRLDRQLTAMILVRVALFVITTTPFVSIRTYQLNQPVDLNDDYAVVVSQLIKAISIAIYNINFAV